MTKEKKATHRDLSSINRLRNLLNDSFSEKSRIYKTKHGTVATMNTLHIGKTPQRPEAPLPTSSDTPLSTISKHTLSKPTSVEVELQQQGKRLGLPYNQPTDQVTLNVERNQTTPNDVDDRLGAQVIPFSLIWATHDKYRYPSSSQD